MKTTPCDIDEIFQKTQLLQNFLKRTTFEPKKIVGFVPYLPSQKFSPASPAAFRTCLSGEVGRILNVPTPWRRKTLPPAKKKNKDILWTTILP